MGGDFVDPLVPGATLDRVDGSQDAHLQIKPKAAS